MNFGHLELFCRDTAETAAFYVRAFEFEETVKQPGGYIWLQSGAAEVLLRPGDPGPALETYAQSSLAVVLYCNDLKAKLAELNSLGIAPAGNDGVGCPTFRDPDGRWVQLVEAGE